MISPNRQNQRQLRSINKDKDTKQVIIKQKPRISRFPQTRLFVLVLRKIINQKKGRIFDIIKTKQRPKYKYLYGLEKMVDQRIKQSFYTILMYSKQQALSLATKQVARVNFRIFLQKYLQRIYSKVLKNGFKSMKKYQLSKNNNLNCINLCFEHLNDKFNKLLKKRALRQIHKTIKSINLQQLNTLQLYRIVQKLLNKNYRYGFQPIFIKSSQLQYQNLSAILQTKRKLTHEYQNNKRQFLINQRQNMQNLKQAIDNHAYQRNIKLGQVKRDKAIKIGQSTTKIRALQRQLSQAQIQFNHIQRNQFKCKLLTDKRIKLQQRSPGALQKIHNLFNQLKFQSDQKAQVRTSAFIKIILNKQKLKKYLTQYQKIKSQVQQFQIYNNIKLRNMVCLYQNIPIESIKLSQQYILAQQQNISLKQSLNSLLSYHLLKDKGDLKLKQNNIELQKYFQLYFMYVDEQTNGQQSIRNSLVSINSARSLKKKSSLKTSVFSNLSLK